MSTPLANSPPPLPQTGWTTDAPWCSALGVQPESFRRLLKKYDIPNFPFGANVLLEAESVYKHISKLMATPPDEAPKKKVTKRNGKRLQD